jgi:hypothetical protein
MELPVTAGKHKGKHNSKNAPGFPTLWCDKYNFKKPTKHTCGAGMCHTSLNYSVKKGSVKVIQAKPECWGYDGCKKPDKKAKEKLVKKAAKKIMKQIDDHGPVPVAVDATDNLVAHKGWGIFPEEAIDGPRNHAAVLVGYGTDSGKDYWILQNSWGPEWGSGGYGRIPRGKDVIGIESGGATYFEANVPKLCDHKPRCANGGSFKRDCTCECEAGFSGPRCEVCKRSCSEGNLQGPSFIHDGKCVCGCKPTWYTMQGEGAKQCSIQFSIDGSLKSTVESKDVNQGTVSAQFHQPKNSAAVNTGDFLFMVPEGHKPYSLAGWNTKGRRTYVCGGPEKTGGQFECDNNKAIEPGYTREHLIWTKLIAGTYDVYFFRYLGKNEFGIDKGWRQEFKLSQRIFFDGCFDKQDYKTWCKGAKEDQDCKKEGPVNCRKTCGLCKDRHAKPRPHHVVSPAVHANAAKSKLSPAALAKKQLALAKIEAAAAKARKKKVAQKAAAKKAAAAKTAAKKAAVKRKIAAKEAAANLKWTQARKGHHKGHQQSGYPKRPSEGCHSFCRTNPYTKGVRGCKFNECLKCPICTFKCYDVFPQCAAWIKTGNCEETVQINDKIQALWKHCPAACNKCAGDQWK